MPAFGSAVPLTGLPPEPKFTDPAAEAAVVTDPIQQIIDELNNIREELSRMMADDMKEMCKPCPITGQRRPLTIEERERDVKGNQLRQRESALMKELRELQATPLSVY